MAISVTGLTVHTQTGAGIWQDWVGGGGSGSSTATFLSSTSSRGRKFTGFKGFGYEVNASGTDLSNSIILVRWLVNGGLGATLAGDGGRIYVEDTSGNEGWWTVAGSDTYAGGWVESVIDTSNALTGNSGTAPSLTALQYVGFYCNAAASSGGDPNVYVDEVLSMPNTGLTLAGNTTNVFGELADWDETSLYGIVTRQAGSIFSKCPLILSPDASDHASTDEIITFEEPIYEDGTNVDSALTLQGLSSADTDTITLTRLTAICEDNADIGGTNADKELDFGSATDIVANNCTFRGFNGTTMALGGSGNDYTGCTFQDCSQVTDTGAVIRECIFRNTATTSGSYLWDNTNSNIQDCSFDVGSGTHGIEHDTIESVATGTVTTANAAGTTLTDSAASFLTTVAVNEYVYNETDGSYAKITSVDSDTQVTTDALQGGTDDQYDLNDAYSISPAQTYTDLTFSGAGTHVNNTATGSDGLFISKSGSSDPSTFTGNVVSIGSVTIQFEAVDSSDSPIQSVRVTAYLNSDNSEIINTTTNASGIATATFAGTTPADFYYRYRKSSSGSTKYINLSGPGTIETGTGATIKRAMSVDDKADPTI